MRGLAVSESVIVLVLVLAAAAKWAFVGWMVHFGSHGPRDIVHDVVIVVVFVVLEKM